MAKFLQGSEINAAIEKLIKESYENLIIISPYIKLHGRIKELLEDLKDRPEVKITLVYGKNDGERYKSLGSDDFNFLKAFPNIDIKYEPRLHAKFYANDFTSVLSSMNLHEYSQNNNIEFGIQTEMSGILKDLTSVVTGSNDLDFDANEYFKSVIHKATSHYLRSAKFERNILSKKYAGSTTEIDELSDSFSNSSKEIKSKTTKSVSSIRMGFCIRTGVKIPLNQKMPYSDNAFKSWSKYSNKAFPEKYDHFTGQESNKETSFEKPVLRQNWSAFQNALKNK